MASTLATRHHLIFSLVKNIDGNIKNSDRELAALIIHKATLLVAFPTAHMAMPRSGSYNTPTVLWSRREALTTNPVVADLLRIRALH